MQRNWIGEFMVKIVFAVLVAAALFMIIVMVIDNHRFVVRNYTVRSPRILSPLKIVFIADLHEKDYGTENEKLVAQIRREKPDVILIGGDLIVSGEVGRVHRKAERARIKGLEDETDNSWMKNSLSLVKQLVQISPVWFVQGNHEIRLEYYEELCEYNALFREEMKKAGVRFIENGEIGPAELCGGRNTGVNIHGLVLPVRYYKKFKKNELPDDELERLIGKADESRFTVLLTHTPVYFETYARWGADLCLCGHVHGGLMRLPLIGGVMGTRPNLFPKYSGGQYSYSAGEGRNSTLILTCGLGTHTLPIRIFNPGEISVVTLMPEKAADTPEKERHD